MNIQNYLSNPMGKGSSIYMVKEARNSLDNQYINVKSRIALVWYNLKDEYYIAHIRIPSKSVDSLFYVSLQLEDTVMVCFRISSCYLLCTNELLLMVDS